MAKESREIKDVKGVVLRGFGELFIKQGDEESLIVETDEEYLDNIKTNVHAGTLEIDVEGKWLNRISTFFSRGYESHRIRYDLTVKELDGLNVSGAARVKIGALKTEELTIRLGGAANISIDSLEAKYLDVKIPGAGNIKIKGKVIGQSVHLGGVGSFVAGELESQDAKVRITGVGKAVVRVSENLDISLTGLGSVDYYGKPRVTQNVSGFGQVTSRG
jgi:hypothetical protein